MEDDRWVRRCILLPSFGAGDLGGRPLTLTGRRWLMRPRRCGRERVRRTPPRLLLLLDSGEEGLVELLQLLKAITAPEQIWPAHKSATFPSLRRCFLLFHVEPHRRRRLQKEVIPRRRLRRSRRPAAPHHRAQIPVINLHSDGNPSCSSAYVPPRAKRDGGVDKRRRRWEKVLRERERERERAREHQLLDESKEPGDAVISQFQNLANSPVLPFASMAEEEEEEETPLEASDEGGRCPEWLMMARCRSLYCFTYWRYAMIT
ncbi:hypothetical protein B296_00010643 [Ensete ventricosum]|uniref:Uncharacterized protein n=1 Tax=Ensete ventricosum TaxID=4639 RepID=A0A426Z2Y3_ENSVE|nr:hypothetical protein B296_00010643 [Ensete ventricosum]